MTTIHDIHCPVCDASKNVIKEGLDSYRCTDCDQVFSLDDIDVT